MDCTILTATEKEGIRSSVAAAAGGRPLRTADDGSQALAVLANEAIDILVLDHPLPDCDAGHLLETALRKQPGLAIIGLVSPDHPSERERLLRGGAKFVLASPPDTPLLRSRIEALAKQLQQDRQQNILGQSRAIRELRELIRIAGPTAATVLVTGESGVGKELVARALHDSSDRHSKPFVAVNAASFASGVLESELFGHEKGSFTGADASRAGKFEAAHGGTIFLDEIGEIDLSTQVKLLRVLEERSFTRVGGNKEIVADVRVIAATNRDLPAEVDRGNFRRDLYYRLKIVEIAVPPLRSHKDDLALLWDHFARDAAQRNGLVYAGVERDVLQQLGQHSWPGNVRELRNAAERAVLLAQGQPVTLSFLPDELKPTPQPMFPVAVRPEGDLERELLYKTLLALRADIAELKALLLDAQSRGRSSVPTGVPFSVSDSILVPDEEDYTSIDEMETEMIRRALQDFDGNRKRAATALGISERTLYRKLKDLSI